MAIGRDAGEGLLFATMGKVTDEPREEPTELDCGDLQLSTCKIKKVHLWLLFSCIYIDACIIIYLYELGILKKTIWNFSLIYYSYIKAHTVNSYVFGIAQLLPVLLPVT